MASGQDSGSSEISDISDISDQVRDAVDPGNNIRMCLSFCSDFMSFLFKVIAIRKV
jgi:hypothetical protein